MKIGEAISQIKSDNRIFFDDSMMTDRFIWNKIKSHSLSFIKQKNDKFNLNSSNFIYSTLNCLEMELVNSTSCCKELPACDILRSVNKLPNIAESNTSSVMRGIFTIDSGKRVSLISINDVIRLENSKYKSKDIKAFIKNGYLFIPWRKTPKAVSIEALWENPEEVELLNKCSAIDKSCINMQDLEWKISSDLQSAVLREVNKELFTFYNRTITDENTNKNENIK